jgi:hypothetical protein
VAKQMDARKPKAVFTARITHSLQRGACFSRARGQSPKIIDAIFKKYAAR